MDYYRPYQNPAFQCFLVDFTTLAYSTDLVPASYRVDSADFPPSASSSPINHWGAQLLFLFLSWAWQSCMGISIVEAKAPIPVIDLLVLVFMMISEPNRT